MAYRLIKKDDGEKVLCRGCKGDRWISIIENVQWGKVICDKCFNAHTVYFDARKYKLEMVK